MSKNAFLIMSQILQQFFKIFFSNCKCPLHSGCNVFREQRHNASWMQRSTLPVGISDP